ncbi:MAG: RecQ family ATP-dependent DNA helicase [Propionibacteriaceae bacterium]
MTDTTALPLSEQAHHALCRLVGKPDAVFHEGQLEAALALVEDRHRALVVQRTGWGKSAVYFVATQLRRAAGAGPTIIISPLLALMRDQIAAAQRAGVRAVTLNSANATEWDEVLAALCADQVDVLLISPERLNNPAFRDEQLSGLAHRCGLLVVDEAHCISDWGHDFRPDYRRIRNLLAELPDATPVLATTATANARVVSDIADQLSAGGHEVLTIRGALARDSLRLGVLDLSKTQNQVAWLTQHLNDFHGSGIIYTLTVAAAEDLAVVLRDAGHNVKAYTGRTDVAERAQLEEELRHNEIKALIATSALGMGFDKLDLGFVIHLGAPNSPVAYYQHIGRAGRGVATADVLLLPTTQDREIWNYFATASMPDQEKATAVISALERADKPLSVPALETLVDLRRTRLELLLKVLDVDGAVQRVQGGWVTTGKPWAYDAQRYQRVTEARSREQDLMLDYQRGSRCRMEFLTAALDDPAAHPCNRCDVCSGPWVDSSVDENKATAVHQALLRPGIEIEPRLQWPTGMDRLNIPVKGKIINGAATGRALARFSDLGMGQRLRSLFLAEDAPVPSDVIEMCIRVLREWGWADRPVAVAWVPSRRHPQLIGSTASALASLGRMTDLGPLSLLNGGPSGNPGGNSAYRLSGVWGHFGIPDAMSRGLANAPGPVLLVDDLVDSRWTLTVCAQLLRRAGATAVLPLTLASEV